MSPLLHTDEVPIDAELVSRLVRDQFPDWAHLSIDRIDSGGTVNAIFQMGTDLAARLPLAEWGVPAIETEFVWSPRLAPHLPLVVPIPVAKGAPGADYPFPWAVHRWIDGEMATDHTVPDLRRAATDLANFVKALQGIDTPGAPANTHRGVPLVTADRSTRAAIGELEGVVDTKAMTAAWEQALAAPDWERSPVWTHGDLWHSNLLARDGRITAVIDFGGVGIGDPAIDMIVAWSLLDADSRHRRCRLAEAHTSAEYSDPWCPPILSSMSGLTGYHLRGRTNSADSMDPRARGFSCSGKRPDTWAPTCIATSMTEIGTCR